MTLIISTALSESDDNSAPILNNECCSISSVSITFGFSHKVFAKPNDETNSSTVPKASTRTSFFESFPPRNRFVSPSSPFFVYIFVIFFLS